MNGQKKSQKIVNVVFVCQSLFPRQLIELDVSNFEYVIFVFMQAGAEEKIKTNIQNSTRTIP